jgi:hypothetical protein
MKHAMRYEPKRGETISGFLSVDTALLVFESEGSKQRRRLL